MKKITVLALVVLMLSGLMWGLGGCIGEIVDGSGNLTTEHHVISGFTEVEVHDGFEVELKQGDEFSVAITADDNVHEYIKLTKTGDKLSIRLLGTRFYNNVTVRAAITIPSLYELGLSGGSQGTIEDFSSAHTFRTDISGGSQLEGELNAGDITLNLSGGSQVELAGSADDLKIDGSGGSRFYLDELTADDADIALSGGSRASINASGTLDTDLSGGSRVEYVGSPTLGDIELSGDSSINKK